MNHCGVDGYTGAGRIAAVIQERRFCALTHDKIVNGLINLPGGHARSYHFPCQSTGCRGNFTGLTHGLQLMGIFDCDHFSTPIARRMSWNTSSMGCLPLITRSLPVDL